MIVKGYFVRKLIIMKKLFFILFAATVLFACKQPANSTDSVATFNLDSAKVAIAAANNVFTDAFAKGDSLGVSNCYAKDGCIMPTGTPKICGREGIAGFFTGAKKMGMASIKLTPVEVTGGKDLVSEEGTYEISGADGNAFDKGKYIVNWIQEDGQWKIYRDIFNSDMPPAPMPAKK
jgi:uncharacterized protein (TIGR02246 family)